MAASRIVLGSSLGEGAAAVNEGAPAAGESPAGERPAGELTLRVFPGGFARFRAFSGFILDGGPASLPEVGFFSRSGRH